MVSKVTKAVIEASTADITPPLRDASRLISFVSVCHQVPCNDRSDKGWRHFCEMLKQARPHNLSQTIRSPKDIHTPNIAQIVHPKGCKEASKIGQEGGPAKLIALM